MKNKWLIGALSCVMATTLCLGIAACGGNGTSDEEIAQSGITMLNGIYLDGEGKVKDYETPADYLILSRTKVGDEFYSVNWSVTSETENIGQYVKIGTEADESARYTVEITRATFDIEYTLTASITVGNATKTADYGHKIPKKSSEDAVTASISFTTSAANTVMTAEQQVWVQNGITVTNDKANSSTEVTNGGLYSETSGHIRLYANSTLKIEFPGIKIITFHSQDDTYKYYSNLKTVLANNGYTDDQIVADDETNTITLTLATPQDEFNLTMSNQCRIFSIDIEGVPGGASDAEKVAVAKAALSLSKDRYSATGSYDLPTSLNGATLEWSVKGSSQYLNVANNKLNITSLPTEETQVTLVAAISAGTASDMKEITITVAPASKLEGSGTEDDPYTVADVFELLKEIEAQTYYKVDGKVAGIYVKGIVIDAGSVGDHDNWEKAYIADSADAEKSKGVQLYGLDKDSQFLPKDDSLVVGATITVYGALQNWYDEPEMSFNGKIRLHAVAYELPVDDRTPQQKVEAALQALETTFTVTKAGDTDLPASTVKGVTFAWATTDQTYTIANNKITVAELPAADATVTATVTATCGTEAVTNNTKTVTITIRAKSDEPQPGDALELTRETLFAGITGTGYNLYNGAHTVGGAEVTTSNVLGTDNYYDGSSNLPFGFTVMQFKKTDGTLSLKGTFTKIVVVIATSYDYDSADKLTITAGSTTLTAGNHTAADANFSQGGKAWKFYTIEYDVTTTGEQTITFKGATHAVYVKSITLTGTASQGGTVDPEPELPDPAKGTAIDEQGATVFDFSDVAVATDYNVMTNAAVLAAFKNASEAGLTSVEFDYIYAGNNGTSGPAAYQGKGGFLRLGKSKTNGTFTLNFSKDINKIQILCLGWSDSDTIAIDGFNPATIGNTTPVASTFTLTKAVKSFTITSADRAFIFKIAVTFADGSTVEPEPSDTTSVTFDASKLTYQANHDLTSEQAGDVTITFSKGTGSNNPIFHNDSKVLRIYNRNTFTVTAPAGNVITKITFTFGSGEGTNEITSDKGAFESPVWTGSTNAVTFTIGGTSGHRRISQLVIEYKQSTEPEHVHKYTYEYNEGEWTHTGTCNEAGCDETTVTEECDPVLNHCEKCEHTYTEAEILAKLFGLTGNNTVAMKGTYSLQGKVLRIDTAYASNFGNVTFTMKVGDKEIQCFREKSSHSATVKPGDTVTVQGTLKHYYNGTKEFDTGCEITNLTVGELTNAEKVSEALRAVTLPASATADVTLPTTAISGVVLTWASDNEGFAIDANTTLKVTQQNEEVTLKITVTAKCGEAEDTKDFTVVIPAKLPDGAETATVSIAEYARQHAWKNQGAEVYDTVTLNDNIEAKIVGTGNTGKYYSDWRIYQTGGGGITITAKNGYTLYSVKVTYSAGNSGILKNGDAQVVSDVAVRVEGTSVTLMVGNTGSATNGQAKITAIEVIYVPASPAAAAASVAPVAILPGKQF